MFGDVLCHKIQKKEHLVSSVFGVLLCPAIAMYHMAKQSAADEIDSKGFFLDADIRRRLGEGDEGEATCDPKKHPVAGDEAVSF